jgi:hypothetical protein
VAFVSDGGKIIRHGRQVFLKISGEALDIFVMIRERYARILAEGGAVPETSCRQRVRPSGNQPYRRQSCVRNARR